MYTYLYDIKYKGEIFKNSECGLKCFSEFKLEREGERFSVITTPYKGKVLLNHIKSPNTKAIVLPPITANRENYCTIILTENNTPIFAIEMRYL
ncbi:MAG: hypothetical protein QW472_01685 [Candidatus Aenigmatarchaeota archaeon]